jgi:hypothetical protein
MVLFISVAVRTSNPTILGKLTVVQPVKNFSEVYGTGSFIILFTGICNWTVP